MRRTFMFLFFSLIILLPVGCDEKVTFINYQTATISDLIYNQAKIASIGLTKEQEGVYFCNIKDPADIKGFLKTLSNICVDKLSPEQDIAFMDNGRKLLEKGLYMVDFYDESPKLSGLFFIWPDGKIYVIDTRSMNGEKRTISYLSKDFHPEIYQWIIDKTKEMAVNGE